MGKKLMTLAAYDLEVGMTLANGHKIVELNHSLNNDFVWLTLDNGDVFGSGLQGDWLVVDDEPATPDTPFTVAEMAELLEAFDDEVMRISFRSGIGDFQNGRQPHGNDARVQGYRLAKRRAEWKDLE